ncbi:MAG: hypothetical protein AB7S75_14305 [Desulfococcaceae bacterium]
MQEQYFKSQAFLSLAEESRATYRYATERFTKYLKSAGETGEITVEGGEQIGNLERD